MARYEVHEMKRYSIVFCCVSVACALLVLADIPYIWIHGGSKWVAAVEYAFMLGGLAAGLIALVWGKNNVVRLAGFVGLAVTARYALVPLALLVSSLVGGRD